MSDNIKYTDYIIVKGEKKYFQDVYGRQESENRDASLQDQIGSLSDLKTTDNTDIVAAVNENKTRIDEEIHNRQIEINEEKQERIEQITALRAAVGSPLVAHTASEMTDHTKIYVYTGDEDEYITGSWYYWNEDNWYVGGVYQSTGVNTDTTLTVAGAAADSKVTGDNINNLKSAMRQYNAENVLVYGEQETKTHNNTTFTWTDKEHCHVTCTKTTHSMSLCNIFYNPSELPEVFEAGQRYYFNYSTTVESRQRCLCDIWIYRGESTDNRIVYNVNESFEFVIPEDATGIVVRLRLIENYTVDESIAISMLNAKTNVELFDAYDKIKNSIYGTQINTLLFGNFEKTAHNGITFTPITDGFEINGTSTNIAFTNVYYNRASLIQGLNPGDNLYFVVDGVVTGVQWQVAFYDLNDALILPIRYIANNTDIKIPSNASGMYVRLSVDSGVSLTGTKTTAKIFIIKANKYYGIENYNKVAQTSQGITYEWDESSSRYYIHGTATATSFYNMWHSFYSLPAGIDPGNKIVLAFNSDNRHIVVIVLFYDSSKNVIQNNVYKHSEIITVPTDAIGMTLRFTIYSSYEANDYVYIPTLSEFLTRADVIPVSIGKPKYITFIDDDTSSDTYVNRYYQACMHNGIKGSYAVCTKHYTDGRNNLETLKQYEAEGFNLCLHCDSQEIYLQPTSPEYDEVEARKNYIRAINAFQSLGLINCRNSWIIPYGSISEGNIKTAKDLNFDVAFTTSGDVYNTIYDNNVYTFHRTGLSSSGDVMDDTNVSELGTMARCKARVDELVSSDEGGWLIITTHFNEWDDMTWDSNTDDDGYQIGYTRFNEFVQYALNAGLTPISISEGVAYMKPLIERNVTRG